KSEYARQCFESVATGVGYPAVADKDFGAFYVPVPKREEQVRIAAYLDASCAAADAAVRAKHEQLAGLASMRESMIEAAVTSGIAGNDPVREVNIDWIRTIPSHWRVSRLKRLMSQVDYGISESTEQTGAYAVLKMGNLQGGEIQLSALEY